eukprot:3045877-Prymnesium_polylepis.1
MVAPQRTQAPTVLWVVGRARGSKHTLDGQGQPTSRGQAGPLLPSGTSLALPRGTRACAPPRRQSRSSRERRG